jgi:hypothetical protein
MKRPMMPSPSEYVPWPEGVDPKHYLAPGEQLSPTFDTGEIYMSPENDIPKMRLRYYGFQNTRRDLAYMLRQTPPLNRNTWQALDVSDSPLHAAHELLNVNLTYDIPDTQESLQDEVQADQPWAELHFQERVSGEPLNPPPSHSLWPHAARGNSDHLDEKKQFDHTYPERFWPKFANVGEKRPNGRQVFVPHNGIRFEYGDLNGVVEQLAENPLTRQAYLPMWFPEDTGSIGRRVPCTLGYHFMADADHVLHMWYFMRACDFIRHFHNDVYLAGRLLQWVVQKLDSDFTVGQINMSIANLHVFVGDLARLPQ